MVPPDPLILMIVAIGGRVGASAVGSGGALVVLMILHLLLVLLVFAGVGVLGSGTARVIGITGSVAGVLLLIIRPATLILGSAIVSKHVFKRNFVDSAG